MKINSASHPPEVDKSLDEKASKAYYGSSPLATYNPRVVFMLHGSKNIIFLIIGHIFLATGIIGAFIPLLPTTPFLILSAFCYSKGSPRMHQWLLSMPTFGPLLMEWEKYGIIRTKAKILASISIMLVFGSTLYFADVPMWVRITLLLLAAVLLLFIITRPSQHLKQ